MPSVGSRRGTLYRRGKIWWIRYGFHYRHQESSGSTRKADAQALLVIREAQYRAQHNWFVTRYRNGTFRLSRGDDSVKVSGPNAHLLLPLLQSVLNKPTE